ncbi:flagellar hook-length control protein FliK [Microbulbifer magnicolonia]|uniref:flagellar hook-length control protein FliK n=1 Tax=Microbulbifer magnicolonia TaxID=3109744 RepID=UPI002B4078E0|nr:flagellar hook-length control protein FliK [Microbulbifer sp. GG15]
MSGITSILDTLLHQVLGKRVDVPLPRDLPEPVRAMASGEAIQPVRSDSRLDPRGPLPEKPVTEARSNPRGAPAAVAAGALERGSTQTHFSAAARTIADLLVHYPAPPPAIRSAAALLPAADGGNAPRLAQSLQASVNRSGLFYESHLANWFRGESDNTRLALEPQMRLTRALPAPIAAELRRAPVAKPPASQGLPTPGNPHSEAMTKQVIASGAAVGTAAKGPDAGGGAELALRMPIDQAARDTLHGLLRHQLELLVTPVLRWEGDIWPGIFASLVVQPPLQDAQRESPEREAADDEEQGEESWETRLTIRLGGLGQIGARLDLRGDRLAMTLSAASTGVAECMASAKDELRDRLHALGVGECSLTVEKIE